MPIRDAGVVKKEMRRKVLNAKRGFSEDKLLKECERSINSAVCMNESSTSVSLWAGRSLDSHSESEKDPATSALLEICRKKIIPALKESGYDASCKMGIYYHKGREESDWSDGTPGSYEAYVDLEISWR